MKYPLIVAIVGVLIGVSAYIGILNLNQPIEVENSAMPEVWQEMMEHEVVEELDMIEAATAELERLNAELDAESTRLLEEKSAVEAKAAADVAEIESRLERIRKTRASFQ